MSTHYTKKSRTPFIVDDADDDRVRMFTWNLHHSGRIRCSRLGHAMLYIVLFGYAAEGLEWDHINRDPLDCRRSNLRQVTRQINRRNQGTRSDNKTGHPGINFRRGQYHARISVEVGSRITLGRFNTYEEALAVRLQAEETHWGGRI